MMMKDKAKKEAMIRMKERETKKDAVACQETKKRRER